MQVLYQAFNSRSCREGLNSLRQERNKLFLSQFVGQTWFLNSSFLELN